MAWITSSQSQLQERIKGFRENRLGTAVREDSFVEKACSGASELERSLILLIRDVIARECHIPSELLAPNDKTTELAQLMGGVSWVDFLFGGPYGFDPNSFFIQLVNALPGLSIPVRSLDKKANDRVCLRYWGFKTGSGSEGEIGAFAAELAREIFKQASAWEGARHSV